MNNDLIELLKKAGSIFDDGNVVQSEEAIDILIKDNPLRVEPLIVGAQLASESKNLKRALKLISKCLKLNSEDLEILKFSISIFSQTDRFDEVIQYSTKILKLGCTEVDILLKLCTAYRKTGQHSKAVIILKELERRNQLGDSGNYEMACCIQVLTQGIELACKYCLEAIRLNPTHTLANMKMADLLMIGGEPDSALKYHSRLLKSPNLFHDGGYIATLNNYLMVQNYSKEYSRDEIFVNHSNFSSILNEVYIKPDHKTIKKQRKITLGFVSADFQLHPVYHFLLPLFNYIDKSRFEIILFYNTPEGERDIATDTLESLVDELHFILHMSDESLKKFINSKNVSILFDLSGHTARNRLEAFAQRLAPVQINWLGYPNTTGLKNMDYRIVDSVTDPVCSSEFLSTEKLIRIDNCFVCYNVRSEHSDYNFAPRKHSPYINLCCYNNPAKITDIVIKTWASIIEQVDNSRLVLKTRYCIESETRSYIFDKYKSLGVDPSRIVLSNTTKSYLRHMDSFNDMDIALDPFPYNGTTSTCEALFMGIPVVALEGDRHVSRVSQSLLECIGHGDLVTSTIDEYIQKTVDLTADKSRLYDLKCQIRSDMLKSPLMDGKTFASKFQETILNLIPDSYL
ncbi:MAG: hypothetical protein HN675_00335 [Opitutae bacterium]|nr:hypothetical protein [Opitutae bacterium]